MQKEFILADHVSVADSFVTKFLGLMGKKGLKKGEGLLLKRCSSIHTCFMKFAIDVVYLDKNYKVLYIETVFPWRVGKIVKGAKNVLELPQNSTTGLIVGEQCEIKD